MLRFSVQAPGWAAHLHVAYLMTTGHVGNLFSTTSRQPPRSSLTLTDPSWEATDPYGTDLLVVGQGTRISHLLHASSHGHKRMRCRVSDEMQTGL